MKNISLFFTTIILIMSLLLSSCGSKEASVPPENETPKQESSEPQEVSEDVQELNEAVDELDEELSKTKQVEVDEGLIDVEITLPKDMVNATTQEEVDKTVEEKGYKSATLNSDGSVTCVMSKKKHKEILEEIKKTIDSELEKMVTSGDYPNFTDIKTNEDYTNITVTVKGDSLSMTEKMSVLAMYTFAGMYNIYSGNKIDNVHIDFVSEETGEIIDSADSKNMGKDN